VMFFKLPLTQGSEQESKTEQDRIPDFLATLKKSVFFIAVYLYFIGWLYAYYIFDCFGISLNSVDIPFYFFIVYSFTVIALNKLWFILMLGCLFAMNFIKSSVTQKTILTLFLVVLFPVLFYLTYESAKKEAIQIRLGDAKIISFIFSDNAVSHYPQEFINNNANENLMLFAQTKDYFYVFSQKRGDNRIPEIPRGNIYVIPKTNILLATIPMENVSLK
jgi:hypothetical protein